MTLFCENDLVKRTSCHVLTLKNYLLLKWEVVVFNLKSKPLKSREYDLLLTDFPDATNIYVQNILVMDRSFFSCKFWEISVSLIKFWTRTPPSAPVFQFWSWLMPFSHRASTLSWSKTVRRMRRKWTMQSKIFLPSPSVHINFLDTLWFYSLETLLWKDRQDCWIWGGEDLSHFLFFL